MPYKRTEDQKEYHRTYMRTYYKTEKHSTYRKQYRQDNKGRINAQRKQRRDSNPEHYRLKSKEKYQRLKCDVLSAYGGPTCICCGETHIEFLCVDHINGGGNRHRKALGVSGTRFYELLRKQGYPPGYRILCTNCNSSLGWFGYCPHGTLPETPEHIPQQPLAQLALFRDGNL